MSSHRLLAAIEAASQDLLPDAGEQATSSLLSNVLTAGQLQAATSAARRRTLTPDLGRSTSAIRKLALKAGLRKSAGLEIDQPNRYRLLR